VQTILQISPNVSEKLPRASQYTVLVEYYRVHFSYAAVTTATRLRLGRRANSINQLVYSFKKTFKNTTKRPIGH